MGKIAFVFSGQGDQYSGMGRELAERHSVARQVFDRCDRLRPGTSHQCFFGTDEELRETSNTQPCLFAMELAAATVLMEHGICPEMAAGFSLGEMPAAVVSGMLDFETGFRLVCRRGAWMQMASDQADTMMAAVLRLPAEQVQQVCRTVPDVYPVNFNCPGQVTVSGHSVQMEEFSAAIRAAGGRVLPLKVAGAFHSPFMREAAEKFAKELAPLTFRKPRIPLYSDLTAAIYTEDVVRLLSQQICHPVQWEKLVHNIIEAGADTFVEIGPGKTLTNLIRKIDPSVTAKCVTELLKERNLC